MKEAIITLLSLFSLVSFSSFVNAETLLEKVSRTGMINAGARKDATPFGYVNAQQEWTGYSLDLLELIRQQLENKLGKEIVLHHREMNVSDRFELVKSGKVDIACGATTITQDRLTEVDFSVPYFMTGAQFLIKAKDAQQFNIHGTLEKSTIAYIPWTTTQNILPKIYPFARWKPVRNRQEGVEKLNSGEVEAFVSDGILLIGELVNQGNNPRDFVLMPSQPMTTELYGCMLPQAEEDWKRLIDEVIASKENRLLQVKWFSLDKSKFPYAIQITP